MNPAKRIALSFDDAPNPDDPYLADGVRTSRLIAGLRAAQVPEAMVFGVANKLDDAGDDRLRQYGAAGHVVGNHTFDHCDAAKVTADEFLASFARADQRLREMPNFLPYFRFPFLSEGDTHVKRDAIRTGVQALGYYDAYVTVPTVDWYVQEQLFRASTESRPIALDRLRDLVTDMIAETVAFYDELAVRSLGVSPAHVLLLHENDVAALFIGDVVERLRNDGWRIIGATEAYNALPALAQPETLIAANGRVAALARDRRFAEPLECAWEHPAFVERELARRGVW